MISTLRQVLLG